MGGKVEFEWDHANTGHLAAHGVTPAEFEAVLESDPIDVGYQFVDDEDRFRAVGLTCGGRLLSIVYTIRNGRIRAVTAFPAASADRRAFMERFQ